MRSPRQKSSGSGAGAIVTTAIGVYLGNTSHPYWATFLYTMAAVAGLYSIMQWAWVQRLIGVQPVSYAEDSCLGSAFTAQVSPNINISPHAEINPMVNATATGSVQKVEIYTNATPGVPEQTLSVPDIIEYPELYLVSGFPKVTYDVQSGMWQQVRPSVVSPMSRMGLGVWVTNPRAEEGQAQRSTGKIKAHLEFFHGEWMLPVHWGNRAYWVDRAENFTSLNAAETSLVLIGLYEDEKLKIYANRHVTGRPFSRSPRAYKHWRRDLDEPLELETLPIDCIVSLISVSSGHTLTSRKFRISNNFSNKAIGVQDITGKEHLLK